MLHLYHFQRRVTVLMVALLLIFVALTGRLVMLMVYQAPSLAIDAVKQHGEFLPMDLARGEITDRSGIPFTGSAGEVNLIAFPSLITDKDNAALQLSSLTGIPPVELKKRLSGKEPVVILRRVNGDIEDRASKLGIPGILAIPQHLRYQKIAGIPAHVVGYVNKIDNAGVAGIEHQFDKYLRQTSAQTLAVYLDAKERFLPGLGYKVRLPERDLNRSKVVLTVDAGLQERLESVMASVERGAAVVMEPRTGEVLAMVSKPSFNPEDISSYLNNPSSPLVNRAVTQYHPGSVFKLVVAAAALESNLAKPDEIFRDPGYFQVSPSIRVHCSKQEGHGNLDFIDAIAESCNSVFVEVGLRLGSATIVEMAAKFGLGMATGIELPEEMSGSLPDPKVSARGDIANMSIGQKGVMVTPLQLVSVISTIVNDGAYVKPSIVKEVWDNNGNKVYQAEDGLQRQVISPRTARYLRYSMEQVVDRGTGIKASVGAGKTGTAQTGRRNSNGEPISDGWFAGYAPRLSPSIAAVFLVEDGGGGESAAPLFREFVESLNIW